MQLDQPDLIRLNEVRPRRPEQFGVVLVLREHLVVSMKSGLEGRNNLGDYVMEQTDILVSMKSGLEGRNNTKPESPVPSSWDRLNEVRPRRPEQWLASEGRLD